MEISSEFQDQKWHHSLKNTTELNLITFSKKPKHKNTKQNKNTKQKTQNKQHKTKNTKHHFIKREVYQLVQRTGRVKQHYHMHLESIPVVQDQRHLKSSLPTLPTQKIFHPLRFLIFRSFISFVVLNFIIMLWSTWKTEHESNGESSQFDNQRTPSEDLSECLKS
jgi:hypothetical protein